MRKIFKSAWFITTASIIVLAGIYIYFKSGNKTAPELASAERRDITQIISETGSVKPIKNVDLAFQSSGRIASVFTDVGKHVSAGAPLVSLDSSELNAELAKAKANLSAQTAKINQDQINLNNSYANIANTLNSAYTSANDAVRVKVDPLFTNAETTNPQLTFSSSNSQGQIDAQSARILMSTILNGWVGQISALTNTTPTSTLEQSLLNGINNLNTIENFFNILNGALFGATSPSQSTMATYKGYVSSAKAEIDAALTSVNQLAQTISSEKAALASDAATEKSYAAEIDNIVAQLSQTTIYSPISGVVTKQEAKVGEIAGPNAVLISVISDAYTEIDTNVPEVDIAKIHIGDQAKVTLDAYGSDTIFSATVTSIDPAETVIEGVATYLTKLHFANTDSRIKPGMTANIDITSATHKNILALPQRTIHKVQNKEYVSRYIGGKNQATEEVEVAVGLKGSDGYAEILSGVSEHDQVLVPHSTQ